LVAAGALPDAGVLALAPEPVTSEVTAEAVCATAAAPVAVVAAGVLGVVAEESVGAVAVTAETADVTAWAAGALEDVEGLDDP
jgi:hypothetical protein